MSESMSTKIALTTIQAAYGHSLAELTQHLEPLSGLTEYKEVTKGIASCRALRVSIEERRKLLKADSLDYGRNVDAVAKALTELVTKYEEPLRQLKQSVDDEKARAKAAKEQAEREQREAEARAAIEAEQAAARVQREAEERALEQRRKEISKLKAEAEMEAVAARAEAESARRQLEQERAQLAAERHAAQTELSQLRAAREQEQTRARLAAEAEEQRLARAKHEAELEELRRAAEPDKSKLLLWASQLEAVRRGAPNLSTPSAAALRESVCNGISKLQLALAEFDGTEAHQC